MLSEEIYGWAESVVSGDVISNPSDVIVIGDGLIGLSTALELGRAGASCVVIGKTKPGAASSAAAGLLIPSATWLPEPARAFYEWALSLYPAFVSALKVYDDELRIIEGMVEHTADGDTLHELEGAVDNVRLLRVVRYAAAEQRSVSMVDATVSAIAPRAGEIVVTTDGGVAYSGRRVVVAAGAWSPQIAGLPRALPVRPLKGQMIALGASPLSRAIMDDDVYLVPRGGETLAGATVEERGFDITVTDDAVRELRDAAARLCPALSDAVVTRSWAGTRPASPDMLPILGPDPELPSLVYACGHSKNGILLAPATARVVANWCAGKPTAGMVEPFSIARFDNL